MYLQHVSIENNEISFDYHQISTSNFSTLSPKAVFHQQPYKNITRINLLRQRLGLLSNTIYGRPLPEILSLVGPQGQLNMVLQHCQGHLPFSRCSVPSSWLYIVIWLPVKCENKNEIIQQILNQWTCKKKMCDQFTFNYRL